MASQQELCATLPVSHTRDSKTGEVAVMHEQHVHVSLTFEPLDIPTTLAYVRSPLAGAIVLFVGTTRDSFDGKPVLQLQYESYAPLAIRTMETLALRMKEKYDLKGIAIVHRLGNVPIGEDSILIAVSAPHRKAAWEAGEEALEECKKRVEVWKLEEFVGNEGGVWRSNRDAATGVKVSGAELQSPSKKGF